MSLSPLSLKTMDRETKSLPPLDSDAAVKTTNKKTEVSAALDLKPSLWFSGQTIAASLGFGIAGKFRSLNHPKWTFSLGGDAYAIVGGVRNAERRDTMVLSQSQADAEYGPNHQSPWGQSISYHRSTQTRMYAGAAVRIGTEYQVANVEGHGFFLGLALAAGFVVVNGQFKDKLFYDQKSSDGNNRYFAPFLRPQLGAELGFRFEVSPKRGLDLQVSGGPVFNLSIVGKDYKIFQNEYFARLNIGLVWRIGKPKRF